MKRFVLPLIALLLLLALGLLLYSLGYDPPPQPVAAAPAEGVIKPPVARPAPDAEPADAALPPVFDENTPRAVFGTVTNKAGDVIVGATVRAVIDGREKREAKSNHAGAYVLDGVPARVLRLEVSARGYEPVEYRRPSFPPEPRVRWDVELAPAEGLYGVVLAARKPAPEAMILLRRPGERRPMAWTRADGDGRFALDWPNESPPFEVEAFHGQHGQAKVDVDSPGEITLELPGGGYLAGHVVDQDGQPVAEFSITASPLIRPAGGPAAQSFESGVGAFTLGPLAPGETRVWAAAEGYQPGEVEGVMVKQGETTGGLVLKLKRSAILSGRVTDARTRRPIEGALVVPAEWTSSALAESVGAYTDAQGRYRLTALPGTRTSIQASADGYRSVLLGGVEGPPGGEVTRDFALSPQSRNDVPASELTGIGAVLSPARDGVRIAQIMEGGPAAAAVEAGGAVLLADDSDARRGGQG
ncbi:MAG: carboxypeptidase regulatory-like domain-containing protein, partial [Myxococcales bacterium]|nr:carboxypeptidase regulatory-like domain-containing protein [Myxococcales bacterium]